MEEVREIAEEALQYLQDNFLVTLFIAIIVGFLAFKSVAVARKANPMLSFVVGLLGTFIGQFGILYLGLDKIIDQIAAFRIFFDIIAAYIGSFILASIVQFIKPH